MEHLSPLTKQEFFTTIQPPWVLKVTKNVDEEKFSIESLTRKKGGRFFILNWEKMKTREDFYGELINKLELPPYFGKNLNALDECLADVEIMGSGPFVFLIEKMGDIRQGSNEEQRAIALMERLASSGEEWSSPADCGEPWERPAAPFHAVFSFSSLSEVPAAIRQLPDLLDCCGSIQSAQMDD